MLMGLCMKSIFGWKQSAWTKTVILQQNDTLLEVDADFHNE